MDTMPTVVVPATSDTFVAKEKFVCNISRDVKCNIRSSETKVKIRYISAEFTNWFLLGSGKIEAPIMEQVLRCVKHHMYPVGASVIAELGGETEVETTLSEMYYLMEGQGEGEPGTLLNNGHANTFYIRDQKGELRTVNVFWGGNGWRICASAVEEPGKCFMGFGLFSRSSASQSSESVLAA